MKNISVVTTVEIPRQRVADLLVGAFEGRAELPGGCNYWIKHQVFGVTTPPRPVVILEAGNPHPTMHSTYDYPLTEGGEVTFQAKDESGKEVTVKLNLETLAKGLEVMAAKYPRTFADFIAENDDACTADVFVQCVAFGKVVYG